MRIAGMCGYYVRDLAGQTYETEYHVERTVGGLKARIVALLPDIVKEQIVLQWAPDDDYSHFINLDDDAKKLSEYKTTDALGVERTIEDGATINMVINHKPKLQDSHRAAGALIDISHIAFGPDGSVYGTNAQSIYKLSFDGKKVERSVVFSPIGLFSFHSFCFGTDERIYVLSSGKIHILKNWIIESSFDVPVKIRNMALGPDGMLYLSVSSTFGVSEPVKVYTTEGEFFGDVEGTNGGQVCFDPDGTLYATGDSGQIISISPEGERAVAVTPSIVRSGIPTIYNAVQSICFSELLYAIDNDVAAYRNGKKVYTLMANKKAKRIFASPSGEIWVRDDLMWSVYR